MTDLDITELERVRAVATQGEWRAKYMLRGDCSIDAPGAVDIAFVNPSDGMDDLTKHPSAQNAAFIAYAANAWPALVEAVRERDRLREALDRFWEQDIGRDRMHGVTYCERCECGSGVTTTNVGWWEVPHDSGCVYSVALSPAEQKADHD